MHLGMLQADALFGIWTAALAQGSAGTSAAFHAALQLLSSQQPTLNTLASKPVIPLGPQLLLQFPILNQDFVPADGTAGVHESQSWPIESTLYIGGKGPSQAERRRWIQCILSLAGCWDNSAGSSLYEDANARHASTLPLALTSGDPL